MKNRKSFYILLCVLLSFCIFFSIQAAEAVTLSVSSTTASRDDEVTLSLSISDNPGIVALTLGISFDANRLEFVKGTDSGFAGWSVTANQAAWIGNTNSTYNGEILQLTYKVKSDAPEGNAAVTIVCGEGDMADMNENSYIPAINTGVVTVQIPTATVTAAPAFTATATATEATTPTFTATAAATVTETAAPIFTATATSTETATPTFTATATATETATPTFTATATATETATPTFTATATATPTPTATMTPTALPTGMPTVVERFSIWTVDADGRYEDVTGKTILLDIINGEPLQLAALAPNDPEPSVTWVTSSMNVASVDANGLVSGLRAGTATITARLNGAGLFSRSASVKIQVAAAVQPGSLMISGPTEVAVQRSIKLEAVFEQAVQPSNRNVIWSSSDPYTARVNNAGNVTGIRQGSAVISVCSKENESICDSVLISVVPAASSVEIIDMEDGSLMIDLASGDPTYQLSANVLPGEAGQDVIWSSSSASIASVDENGLVTGHRSGTATITAMTTDGSRRSASVRISIGVKVQPGSLSISGPNEVAERKSVRLTAEFNQDPPPTNKNVLWVSSDESVAKVSSSGVVTGVGGGSAEITVCSQENLTICDTHLISVTAAAASVEIIDLEDGNLMIDLASGDPTYQLSARVLPDEAGQGVSWKSSSASVATVDENGLVTGYRSGTATITAMATDGSGKSASVRISIGVKVQPGSLSISGPYEVAERKSVKLEAEFNQDPQPTNKRVFWASSDESVVKVNSSGVVTGVGGGSAEITVCSQENLTICDTHPIAVTAAAASVEIIDLEDGTLMIDLASGDPTYQLSAQVLPADAQQEVRWSSNLAYIASVDENGLVTANRMGSATITASTVDGSRKSASVRISVGVKVQPDSLLLSGPTEVAERKAVKLSVKFNQDPQPTNKRVFWSSSNESVAKVSSTGAVVGVGGGSAVISACSAENPLICDTHTIEVHPAAASVEIIDLGDGTLMIDLGSGDPYYQLSAQVLPADAGQEVNWSSNSSSVATVNQDGLVMGRNKGTATITASTMDGSGKRASVRITVGTKVQPGSLSVSGPEEVAEKRTVKLNAVFNQDPKPSDTGLLWTSSDETVAKVSSSGSVTGVSGGSALITVCARADQSVCAYHQISVLPMVKSLLVYDEEGAGLEIDLASDKLTYQLGVLVDPLDASQVVHWKSSSTAVAEVDENGLVTAMGRNGSVTISATAVDGSNRSHSIRITMKAKVQPGSVRISSGSTHVDVRNSLRLSASFDQAVAPAVRTIVWTSSDPSVARVNSSGVVTGVSDGFTIIRAAAKDDLDIYDEIEISVGDAFGYDLLMASAANAVNGQNITDGAVSGLADESIGETEILAASASVESAETAGDDVAEGVSESESEVNTETLNEAESDAESVTEIPAEGAADAAETDAEPAETVEKPEVQGPHFVQKEIWLKVGESLILDVENPDDDAILVGLGGETDAVLWNDELYMVTSIGEAEVTAFLSTIDPVEIKDMAAIHIVAELPEADSVKDEQLIEAEITEEVSDEVITETEEPAQEAEPTEAVTPMVEETEVPTDEENTDGTNTSQEGSETIRDDQSEPTEEVDATETQEPTEEVVVIETQEPTEEVIVTEVTQTDERLEIRIKDLEEDDDLTGFVGETLTIERERFEMGDDLLRSLVFEIENEAIAVLTERSLDELIADGIELHLLNIGETKLLIKLEGVEEPLREIRLVVEAMPTVVVTEEPAETETAGVPEEQVSETPEPTEESTVVIEETPEPTEVAAAVVEETPALTEEAAAVVEETSEPTEEAAVVIEETPEPTEEPASDIQETSDPVTEDTSGTESE